MSFHIPTFFFYCQDPQGYFWQCSELCKQATNRRSGCKLLWKQGVSANNRSITPLNCGLSHILVTGRSFAIAETAPLSLQNSSALVLG
jgi:hypothetical protein